MQHDADRGSKKQKHVEKVQDENFSILVVENVLNVRNDVRPDVMPKPIFHVVKVNKEQHKEIYKDLKMFEKEDLEIHMDFIYDLSPFIGLKSKSRNYATQEEYEISDEFERWNKFLYDCTYENKNMIRFSSKNKADVEKTRFYIIYSRDLDWQNC
jgi:hypothetical protein